MFNVFNYIKVISPKPQPLSEYFPLIVLLKPLNDILPTPPTRQFSVGCSSRHCFHPDCMCSATCRTQWNHVVHALSKSIFLELWMYSFMAWLTDYKRRSAVGGRASGFRAIHPGHRWNHSLTKIHRNEPQTSCPLCVCVRWKSVGWGWQRRDEVQRERRIERDLAGGERTSKEEDDSGEVM